MFVDTDIIATQLKKTAYADFTATEQLILTSIINAVEALIQRIFKIDLSGAAIVEYLPFGRVDGGSNIDLSDIDYSAGRIIDRPAGAGRTALQLSVTPVLLANLEVWEDTGAHGGQASGAFAIATKLTLGTQYFLDVTVPTRSVTGILHRIGASWPTEARSIKVSYNGGSLASDAGQLAVINQAIALAVAHNFRFWERSNLIGPRGGVLNSESIGKYSYTLQSADSEFGGFSVMIPDVIAAMLAPYFNYGSIL